MLDLVKDKRKLGATLILLFGISLVVYFIAWKERAAFDSDYTDTLIWAKAALDGKGVYNMGFWYAYVLPFSGSLLMIPFLLLFGVSYTTHVLGMITFSILFCVALYGCFKQLGFIYEQRAALTGLCAVLFSVSKTTRMIFWGHVIHYSLGLLFLWVGLLLISKVSLEDDFLKDRKQKVSLCLLFLWCFLCCNNGFSAVLFFVFPFIGALLLERFLDVNTKLNEKANLRLFFVCIGSLISSGIGFLSFYFGQRNLSKSYENYFATITPSRDWIWEGSDWMRNWVTLSTEILQHETQITSLRGITILLLFLFSLVIVLLPVAALFSYRKFQNKMMRVLLLSHWILFLATMLIYSVSPAKGTNWRMCGLYGSCVVLSAVYVMWLTGQKRFQRFGNAALCFLAAVALLIALLIAKIPSAYGENRYDRLTMVLKEHELSYGYGEFWSANVTTILSDSEVRIRPIVIQENGSYEISHYQSQPDWYEDQPEVNRYFVFLSNYEYEYAKQTLVKDSIEEIPFDEDGTILVFDYNVMGGK